MIIHDISPKVSSRLAVWPGDQSYHREVSLDTNKGDHIGLSKIQTTLHLGAHTDAPNHYVPSTVGIDQRALNYYLGPAQVITVDVVQGGCIEVADLKECQIDAPRVLLRTGSFPNPEVWNEDFCSLSRSLVDYLADQQVILVGIDTPSVDPFVSKDLPAHRAIHNYNMAILEGIVLNNVVDGTYMLSALPLALEDADASPVRAVLFEL